MHVGQLAHRLGTRALGLVEPLTQLGILLGLLAVDARQAPGLALLPVDPRLEVGGLLRQTLGILFKQLKSVLPMLALLDELL